MTHQFCLRGLRSYCLLLTLLLISQLSSARETVDLNKGWTFTGTDLFGEQVSREVDLPHSWNGSETWDSDLNRTVSVAYSRNQNLYQRELTVLETWRGKRLFLRFEAANTVARLHINGKFVGEHRGGYSAFNLDITDYVNFGEANSIEVSVDNSYDDDIIPLIGDFNVYGGLIRPVSLIVTDSSAISLRRHGSFGVYIDQIDISDQEARIEVRTLVDHFDATPRNLTLRTSVFDQVGQLVISASAEINLAANSQAEHRLGMPIENPTLWQGVENPYLYQVNVSLLEGDRVVDEVIQPMGLRAIGVDPKGRLLLNGEVYRLRGVGFHEDWPGVGPALSTVQRATDIELIRSMGANAIRLAHYPHGLETLAMADQSGLVAWSEIPFVGSPFGPPLGYTDSDAFRGNAKQQLLEMIHQQYNHPSVFFWGIFNEVPKSSADNFDPLPLVHELNALAKAEDSSRLTSSASAGLDEEAEELGGISDVQFWNHYFGWYHGKPEDVGAWLDATKKQYPDKGIGLSEYGAGASFTSYQERLEKPYGHGDRDHPEKWQSHLHQRAWDEIQRRDFVLGSFVWAMFDFSSSIRKEGGHDGLNTKGLVSYDRKVKKDAFYYYQANWSNEPMLYIADRRSTGRRSGATDVQVFSNAARVELQKGMESLGTIAGDNGVFRWEAVAIEPGNNLLLASASFGEQALTDRVAWYYNDNMARLSSLMPVFGERKTILLTFAALLLLFYAWGFRGRLDRAGVLVAKTGFWAITGVSLLYLLAIMGLHFAGLLIGFG